MARPTGERIGGTIVVLCSCFFFISLALRPLVRGPQGLATSV